MLSSCTCGARGALVLVCLAFACAGGGAGSGDAGVSGADGAAGGLPETRGSPLDAAADRGTAAGEAGADGPGGDREAGPADARAGGAGGAGAGGGVGGGAGGAGGAAPAPGDDTHACLSAYGGPLIVVRGTITSNTTSDSGYRLAAADVADNTRFDARTAFFRLGPAGDSAAGGVAFGLSRASLPANSVCIAGGKYQGIYDRTISWAQGHDGNGQLAYIAAPDTTIDGIRADNIAQDAPSIQGTAQNFAIRNSWFTYVRDDCVQNDGKASGIVEDNLYDGCYTFLSHQDETAPPPYQGQVVRVRRNLIRLQNMPKPYDYERFGADPQSLGFGSLFKQAVGGEKPVVDFTDNVVFLEDNLTPRPSLRDEKFEVRLGECRGNVLVWIGAGDLPDDTWRSLPAGCIARVYRGAEGRAFWDAARKNWIDCHPLVARVDGDPPSTPAACDPARPGG